MRVREGRVIIDYNLFVLTGAPPHKTSLKKRNKSKKQRKLRKKRKVNHGTRKQRGSKRDQNH